MFIFIENILTIPLESHYKKNIGKNVLMEAMKNILPNEILLRPKQGFSRPTHLLLTDNNIKFIQSQLKNIPFLNYNYLSNLIKTENKIKKNQSLVWRLLVFSWWFNYNKKYITL